MFSNICRLPLRRLILPLVLAFLPLQAETLQYSVPPFQSRAWHPATTRQIEHEESSGWVWREGAWVQRWVTPPPVWTPPVLRTESWPDEYETVTVPAITQYVEIPATYQTITIPG